jgi:hypothetical protein
MAGESSLFEYRIYVRAPNLEWQLWETIPSDVDPQVRFYRAKEEHPELTLRLARWTRLKEWWMPDRPMRTAPCEHVWKYAHVVKRGLQRYRIYYCEKCLTEREGRV